MAKCVHEALIPMYNPFSNPFSSGTAADVTEPRWVCICWASTHLGLECTNSELKVRCCHYRPESVTNRMPEKTEGEHEPPPM